MPESAQCVYHIVKAIISGKNALTQTYAGKKVLVTGGTGSIGRELATHLLAAGVEVVRVLSNDENGLFDMQERLNDHRVRYLLGDVRDNERMRFACQDIDFVFHAAALKHVPIGEYNPFEVVMTNVVGTKTLIDACLTQDVKRFTLISTDKAVNPINTLGASKLLCEKLVTDAEAYKGHHPTKFCSVRFGNVLQTRGSVTETFRRQISRGGPVILTDEEMTRFALDRGTAVARVLKAVESTEGGEIFVIKMKSLRIRDLAEAMIEEVTTMQERPVSSIQIQVGGIRPGEKIHEELMTEEETANCHETGEFYIVTPRIISSQVTKNKVTPGPYTSRDGPFMNKEEIRNLLNASKGDYSSHWN